MEKDAKIFVAGASGLVGSALVRELESHGYENILAPSHHELDLEDPVKTKWWFSVNEPDYVFFCAARVGGIADNVARKVDFFLQNMHIELNTLENSAAFGVQKLVFVGTSCVYPRDCPQPIKEEYLWTGPLEKTTEAYSVAKLAGMKLCQYYREEWGANYVVALPCNIFGRHDDFNGGTAHCLPGLMARLHAAKIANDPFFEVWGSGEQQREFLYADDLARALITVMDKYNRPEPINTGSGLEMTIQQLAIVLAGIVGYEGRLEFNSNKPSGTPRKILDNSKISALEWEPQVPFLDAVKLTYQWFLEHDARS